MQPVCRAPVVTRGPTALEPTVDDGTISVSAFTNTVNGGLDARIAGGAAIRSDVEVWQLSLEKKGDM